MKWRSLQESDPGNESRPLRDVLAERRGNIVRYVPPDVQAVHERTVAALISARHAAQALGTGARAPSFEVPDHSGRIVSSSGLLREGSLVVCFIRGRWCPFDVGQMEAMNAIAGQIEAAGASLLAISPQTGKQSYFMRDQHKLRFPLLVDAGNAVARKFGLAYRVPEEQQEIYSRTFVNLPFLNGDPSWELPIPATYVIDAGGAIVFAAANENYMERPEPLEILGFLEQSPGQPR